MSNNNNNELNHSSSKNNSFLSSNSEDKNIQNNIIKDINNNNNNNNNEKNIENLNKNIENINNIITNNITNIDNPTTINNNNNNNNTSNNNNNNNIIKDINNLNTQFDTATDPILNKNYNIQLDNLQKFREDILTHTHLIQNHLQNLINSQKDSTENFISDFNIKLNSISDKANFLSDLISKTTYKLNKIDELITFKKKSEDQLLSHEIKLKNTADELSNAIFKYDKIYIENLKVPGFVGSSLAPYKNMSEYVSSAIQNVTNLINEKEAMKKTLNEYKIRQDNMTREVNTLIGTSIQRCNDYTDSSKNMIEKDIDLLKENFEENLMKLRMENVKESINLKEKSEKLMSEWEIVSKIKEDIEKKLLDHLFIYKTDANESLRRYEEMRKEFKHVKRRFGYLVEFIKDIRFRRNLDLITNRDKDKKITKSDIKNLVGKIQFTKNDLNESIDSQDDKKIDVDYDFFKGKDVPSSDEDGNFANEYIYKKLNQTEYLDEKDKNNNERNKNRNKTAYFNINNNSNNNNNNNSNSKFVRKKMIRSKTLKVMKKMKSIKINNKDISNNVDDNSKLIKTEREKKFDSLKDNIKVLDNKTDSIDDEKNKIFNFKDDDEKNDEIKKEEKTKNNKVSFNENNKNIIKNNQINFKDEILKNDINKNNNILKPSLVQKSSDSTKKNKSEINFNLNNSNNNNKDYNIDNILNNNNIAESINLINDNNNNNDNKNNNNNNDNKNNNNQIDNKNNNNQIDNKNNINQIDNKNSINQNNNNKNNNNQNNNNNNKNENINDNNKNENNNNNNNNNDNNNNYKNDNNNNLDIVKKLNLPSNITSISLIKNNNNNNNNNFNNDNNNNNNNNKQTIQQHLNQTHPHFNRQITDYSGVAKLHLMSGNNQNIIPIKEQISERNNNNFINNNFETENKFTHTRISQSNNVYLSINNYNNNNNINNLDYLKNKRKNVNSNENPRNELKIKNVQLGIGRNRKLTADDNNNIVLGSYHSYTNINNYGNNNSNRFNFTNNNFYNSNIKNNNISNSNSPYKKNNSPTIQSIYNRNNNFVMSIINNPFNKNNNNNIKNNFNKKRDFIELTLNFDNNINNFSRNKINNNNINLMPNRSQKMMLNTQNKKFIISNYKNNNY